VFFSVAVDGLTWNAANFPNDPTASDPPGGEVGGEAGPPPFLQLRPAHIYEVERAKTPPELRFGDSVAGLVPTPVGAEIKVTYLATSGLTGNVAINTIVQPRFPLVAGGNVIQLTITNDLPTSGGLNPQNPDQVRAYMDQHRDFLDDFGRSIHEPIDAEMRLEAVGAWVEERCKAGCRIIAVDPITAAMSTETPWVDDQRFILRAKRAVEAAGASLVVVTHPRKGRKGGSDLDDLAGGTAYQRFAQTVIWLEHHYPPENMTVVRDLGGRQLVMVNRTACVRKARNGPGQGWKVALNLLPESLTFSELGPVVDEEREK